jgi:hypothetical protein
MRLFITLIVLAAIWTSTCGGNALSADQAEVALKVFCAIPEQGLWIIDDNKGQIDVVIQNCGDRDVRLYDSWNSWGYYNISIAWTDSDGNRGTIRPVAREWDKNVPSSTTVPAGEVIVRSVSIDPKKWQGWPKLRMDLRLKLVVTYESQKQGTGWTGKVISREVAMEVVDRRA